MKAQLPATYYTYIQLIDRGYGYQPHYTTVRRSVRITRIYPRNVTGEYNVEVADVTFEDGSTGFLRLKHLENEDGSDARKTLLGRSYAEIKLAGKALFDSLRVSHNALLLGEALYGNSSVKIDGHGGVVGMI